MEEKLLNALIVAKEALEASTEIIFGPGHDISVAAHHSQAMRIIDEAIRTAWK